MSNVLNCQTISQSEVDDWITTIHCGKLLWSIANAVGVRQSVLSVTTRIILFPFPDAWGRNIGIPSLPT